MGVTGTLAGVTPVPPPPDGSPRVTRRRAATRRRLLDAAFELWASKGFWSIRIEEIAEAAGFTRGAFYSNFSSVDEVFFALFDRQNELMTGRITELFSGPDGEEPTLIELIQRTAASLPLDRRWLMIRYEYLLHAARNPALASRLGAERTELRDALEQHLARHADRLGLTDVPATARAVMAAYDGVSVGYLLDNDEVKARRWLAHLLSLLLGPPPGGEART